MATNDEIQDAIETTLASETANVTSASVSPGSKSFTRSSRESELKALNMLDKRKARTSGKRRVRTAFYDD